MPAVIGGSETSTLDGYIGVENPGMEIPSWVLRHNHDTRSRVQSCREAEALLCLKD